MITIFQAIGLVSGTYTTLASLSGNPIGGPEAAEYTKYLTPFDHVMTLVMMAITTAATVQLFRLKRSALPIFVAAALFIGIAIVGFNFAFRPDYRAMFELAGYWTLLIGWGVNLAIIGYVWRLRSKGVLQP